MKQPSETTKVKQQLKDFIFPNRQFCSGDFGILFSFPGGIGFHLPLQRDFFFGGLFLVDIFRLPGDFLLGNPAIDFIFPNRPFFSVDFFDVFLEFSRGKWVQTLYLFISLNSMENLQLIG